MLNFKVTKPLLVISGPTASGKSAFAIKCAKLFYGEIISADSMQVYKGLDIGTAKILKKNQQNIKHHLIDIKELNESFNAYEFKKEAEKIIDSLHEKNILPIVCGGTGLYINSLIFDYDFNNTKNPTEKYNVCLVVLSLDRQELYARINKRIDEMIEEGLIDEAKALIISNVSKDSQCFASIGYKEFLPFFEDNDSLKNCINILKQNTRNYAKRQLTWFNNQWPQAHFVDAKNAEEIFETIEKELKFND